ncbi:PorT family protein [Bacteroidales bacterium OttesenSCG-928-B11]|nr:PorT family protein [Bacteroidales bacterium OttesenSCG-928-E04]MDL2308141.1 PorT family protein [Bacteroidales bacterium OttesenSCG-928-C03]MDL2311504.1 PorT family protein [Bacteroidales bacterium OttesenSCG-928-B11]MDL2325567.1 PorT family protein [Bacteroidales bacterium OttesenSCG-928-A14]
MKKITLLLALSLLLFCSKSYSQMGIGVEAGYLFSPHNMKSDYGNELNNLHGFNIGGNYKYDIDFGISVQAGLVYSFMMKQEKESFWGETIKSEMISHYLSIPLNVSYEYGFNDNFKLFAFAGPRFDIGLSFKSKAEYSSVGLLDKGSVEIDYYTGKISSSGGLEWMLDEIGQMRYNRFDLQLGLGVGTVLFEKFIIKTGYDWGLINKFQGPYRDFATLRRGQYYFNLGFLF